MRQEDADPGNLVLRAADAFNGGVRICRVCGCTDDQACVWNGPGGVEKHCFWLGLDLCSACSDDAGDVDVAESAPLLYDAYGGVLVR